MHGYDHTKIEKKWQKEWAKKKLYVTKDAAKGAKNYFLLVEFPYPSGNLHVGHWYAFAVPDILARHLRMTGKNVLYPIGFDAFGLPAENAAIKNNLNPRKWTYGNIAHMEKQIASMGSSFDWTRKVVTADPEYYKWTQWLFLQFFKNGLAYKKETAVNWCPKDKTVLANEQVVGGCCERCGTEVEQRNMLQWNIKITKYADRLVDDLNDLDWPEQIKDSQRNWIGRSEGALISFKTTAGIDIPVFTTRPDTLFGATYMVVAPEHRLVEEMRPSITNWDEVAAYRSEASKKTELERQENKEKSGVELKGIKAINPGTKKEIPIFIADYALAHYGTGALMAVPAHDERDGAFAEKFELPIVPVILKRHMDSRSFVMGMSEDDIVESGAKIIEKTDAGFFKVAIPAEKIEAYKARVRTTLQNKFWNEFTTPNGFYFIFRHADGRIEEMELNDRTNDRIDAYGMTFNDKEPKAAPENVYSWLAKNLFYRDLLIHTEEGILVNSKEFNGLSSEDAKHKITQAFGEAKTTYKMRDWVVSRQRYWGVPIPIIHCPQCGDVAVPDKDLPVKLPEVKDYLPTGDGKSPLAKVKKFVEVKCPQCKGKAERETDTFDTFVDSSWYFQRYTDPKNKKSFADAKKLDAWMPVDLYSGGAEHTTMHVLYSRFWQKAMYDLKLVKDKEPYTRRMNRSLIMGPDGQKMSKSKGNVIDPDEVVRNLGADTVRMYLAFIGPYNEVASYPWNPDGVVGVRRFLERVWRLSDRLSKKSSDDVERALHGTIKKVTDDIPQLKFNTAIASMMMLMNEAEGKGITKGQFATLLKLLAPFAPHIAEELWRALGNKKSIHLEKWPKFDAKKTLASTTTIVIQVNGKVRGNLLAAMGASESDISPKAREVVQKWLERATVKKTIFVPNRLVNFVIDK